MAGRTPCDTCVQLGTGVCRNNNTCVCFGGFLGPTCADRVTTQASTSSTGSASNVNVGAIVAGVLGGVLLAVLIVLAIYFFVRRRTKKTTLRFTPSITSGRTEMTTRTNGIIVAPALYNIASSRRESLVSNPGLTYHFYEELP